jgi:hypothetical protein
MGNLYCAREYSVQFLVQFIYTVKLQFNLECTGLLTLTLNRIEMQLCKVWCKYIYDLHLNITFTAPISTKLQLPTVLFGSTLCRISPTLSKKYQERGKIYVRPEVKNDSHWADFHETHA